MRYSLLGTLSCLVVALLAVLLAMGILVPDQIIRGIIGNAALQPWKIITIFFTVAYVAVSTDRTGIFSYFAHRIIHYSRGDGRRLFLFFFLFAGAMAIVTSNDIVILTLTPIIFYLGRFAKINVLPFLFAEFFAAHTMDMALYTGDPTNIIVASTLGFGFLEYSKVMILPAVVAATSSWFLLRWRFHKDLTRTFHELKRADTVPSWPDAIASFALLIIMLLVLIGSDYLPWSIWMITTAFATLFILKDLVLSIFKHGRFLQSVKSMPWLILPFIICVFIFVQAIVDGSFMTPLAKSLAIASSPAQSIALFGSMGIILSNIINNQPATILLTHVLIHPSFAVSVETQRAGAFALAIASNLGATFTLLGALAGIMWQTILREKGLSISYLQFTKTTLVIAIPVSLLTLLTLAFVV